VIVSFIVEKDGSLTDIKVLRDMGLGTGEEAMRLLKKSPKWRAGVQNGRNVRVQYTFRLCWILKPVSRSSPDAKAVGFPELMPKFV